MTLSIGLNRSRRTDWILHYEAHDLCVLVRSMGYLSGKILYVVIRFGPKVELFCRVGLADSFRAPEPSCGM